MVFQRRGVFQGEPVLFEGAPIPSVEQFRYLGVTFTPAMDMVQAAGQCAGSLMAGWREVLLEAKARGEYGMPHVLLHLAQMYVSTQGSEWMSSLGARCAAQGWSL